MNLEPGEKTLEIPRARWTKRVFYFCLGSEIAIALADLLLNYLRWLPSRALRRAVNITREDAIGNWFSSTQSLVVGIVLWLLYLDARSAKTSRSATGWAVLAAFFTYMAIDDATKLHERVGTAFEEWFGSESEAPSVVLEIFPTYTWQLVLGPFFAAMGLYILWFVWRELDARYRPLVVGALACLAVAVGLDFVEGMNLQGLTSYDARHIMKLVEEFLEQLGITFFLVTFLSVLLGRWSSIRLLFR